MNSGDKEWENFLKEDDMFFKRDHEGKLLPEVVELKSLEAKQFVDAVDEQGVKYKKVVITKPAPKVKLIPASRGEWLRILELDKYEQDKKILTEFLVEPKIKDYDKEKVFLKPLFVAAIINAFTALTLDVSQDVTNGQSKEELTKVEEENLKKKSEQQNVE